MEGYPKGNPNFPIIFQTIKGNQKVTDSSSSYYNEEEQICVLNLIKELLRAKFKDRHGQLTRELSEDDIGVVSPYRKQCDKMTTRLCQNQFDKITVGTAETFQGQERLVMIMSTVRSDHKLGFVSETRVNI